MHDKREIYRAILNPKREQLFFVGTVTGTEPLQVRLDGDTADVPATNTSGGFFAAEGDRVVLLKYGKQFLCLGVINGVLDSGVDDLRDNVEDLRDTVEAHVDNTTDAHDIDKHFDATAVDDVHGLLSGGFIIEDFGSNENGSWVRWSNGLQICWGSKTFPGEGWSGGGDKYYLLGQSLTFPVPFDSAPRFFGTTQDSSIAVRSAKLANFYVGTSVVSDIAFNGWGTISGSFYLHWLAIGWWK